MTMNNFNQAILFVLRNEGGFNDDASDKGGATNYGISTRFLKQIDEDIDGDGHVTSDDVSAITKKTAIDLYKKYFWDYYRLDEIRDFHLSEKMLDLYVNMRSKSAGTILQKSCNTVFLSLYGKKKFVLVVDGVAGSKTIYAANCLTNFTGQKAELLREIRKEQSEFYHAIVKADKTQKKWLKGWLRRAAR